MTDDQAPDLLPETLPFKVPVTGEGHKHQIGVFYGLAQALDALQAVPQERRVPGFNYALALVQMEEAEARAQMMGLNLRAVAVAGHDITRVKNIALQGNVLVCTPVAPGEEA